MIQSEQFRPAASPLSTVGAPAPTFSAPMPVQSPRAAMPSMAPLPVAPAQTDNSFLNALNNFGSSIGRLGSALQEQHRVDLARETATAEAALTPMNTADAISYGERVQMENKNKAHVAGTNTALGNILASRFQTEALQAQADGSLSADAAPEFLRNRAKEYLGKFNSPEFAKAFSPTAEQTITHFTNLKLTAEAKAVTEQHVQSIIAEGVEGRTKLLGLPAEQQTAAINSYLDTVVEKAGKDKLLSKSEVNGIYRKLAEVASDQGDELFLKIIGDKPRGDQPPLSKFDKDWQGLTDRAAAEHKRLTEVHSVDTFMRLDTASLEGRLSTDPLWKQGPAALKAAGFSEEKIAQWSERAKQSSIDMAYQLNPEHVQMRADAVAKGDVANAPSLNNPTDLAVLGRERIIQMQHQAVAERAQRFEKGKALAIKADADKQVSAYTDRLAGADATAWTSQGAFKFTKADGTDGTASQKEVLEGAMAKALAAIDRQFPGQPEISLNQKVAKIAQVNYVPDSMTDLVKRGAVPASTTAIGQQDPEKRKAGMSAQLGGLSAYRAFDAQGSVDVLRQATSPDTIAFYATVDAMSQAHTNGDDAAAIAEVSASMQRPKAETDLKVASLRLDKRIESYNKNVVKLVNGNSIGGRGASTMIDNNLLAGQSETILDNMVRGGVDPKLAEVEAGKYMARTFGNYKGLLVPKNGNQSYAEVDDWWVKKTLDANPDAGRKADGVALVPSTASSVYGRANSFVLKSTDNGTGLEPMNAVTIQTRSGPVTISDPVHLTQTQIDQIKEAKQVEVETHAAAQQNTKKYDLDSMPGPVQGDLGRSAGAAYNAAIAAGKTEDEARSAGQKFILDRVTGVNEKTLNATRDLLTWGIKQHN